jgi:enamine deaminase RidA (YjgF/YER057c/UK114 family)
MNRQSLFVLLMLASAGAFAGERTCHHANAEQEAEIGYCQAVRAGNVLYVSGTVGRGEMPEAVRSVYRRLRATLAERGLDFSHVVRETVYTTDLDAFIAANESARKPFYDGVWPAASWVQVERLFRPEFVVEVEITAVFPQ